MCSASRCGRHAASCGNSSFGVDASTMRIVRRRTGVDVRASTSSARYPCSEKSESEMPCTGRVAITCGGTKSARSIDLVTGREIYLAEGVRVHVYRAEGLEVRQRRRLEGERGICEHAAQREVADLGLRLEERSQFRIKPVGRPRIQCSCRNQTPGDRTEKRT
jgi:hypothetical protein